MDNNERIASYGQQSVTRDELIQMLKRSYKSYGRGEYHPKIGYVNTMLVNDENGNEREIQTITLMNVIK